ncbi:hypothetical protein SAMN05216337_101778 [Bradyrhizobium brasilense]|uniref:Uncharacterized protein n=1 Tax=Bradyrhizobium brasilense TaxID=1419277 RepID=A0A1G6YRX7_9BRAD|nr:hypothetical protein [Bradyrhizobium brasilense]SDD93254.1 hypothetical protein SAMN05216337_101778 [Bradyrhizobium brasilense]
MDRIDHALGRPLDPTGETYRNYYATDGALADEMAASPFWREGRRSGRLRGFCVTDAGCQALAEHLKLIGDQHRAFAVTFDGHTRIVAATTHSKAKYSYFLDVSDVLTDLTFTEFCRRASVRLAN